MYGYGYVLHTGLREIVNNSGCVGVDVSPEDIDKSGACDRLDYA